MNSVSILIPITDSIHLTLTGQPIGKAPSNVTTENGSNGFRFTVNYSDDTQTTYETEGGNLELVAVDCPGELNFIREVQAGPRYRFFVYTYTEGGITTDEFEFMP